MEKEHGSYKDKIKIVTTISWESTCSKSVHHTEEKRRTEQEQEHEHEHTLRNSVSGRVSFLGAECSSIANIVAGDSSWSQNLRIFVNWGAGNEVEFATALRIKVEMRSGEETVLSVRLIGMWSTLMGVSSYIPNSSWSLLQLFDSALQNFHNDMNQS